MLFPHEGAAAMVGKASTSPAVVEGKSSGNTTRIGIPNPNREQSLKVPTLFPTRHHSSTTTPLPPTSLAGEKRSSEVQPQQEQATGNKRHCTDVTKQKQQEQPQHPPVLGFDANGEVNLKKRSSRDALVDVAKHGHPPSSPSKKSKTDSNNSDDCCFERNAETVPMAISEDDDENDNENVPMELSKAEDPPDAANEVWSFIGVG